MNKKYYCYMQFILGLVLAIYAAFLIYQSINVTERFVEGILLGEGASILLWGFREMIGASLK